MKKLIRKRNAITAVLCLVGITINLLLSFLSEKLGLPLYLDTVGTIAVSFMGGPLPGVIVGFATNLLKSITDESALYYGVLNVLIALAASVHARNKDYKKPHRMLYCAFIYTLIGGGLGSLLPMVLESVSYDSTSLAAVIEEKLHCTVTVSNLIANLMTDFLDKCISVAIVWLLLLFLPKKVQKLFRFSGWMQKPLTHEESSKAKKLNNRVMSLRTKILLVMSIALFAVSAAATLISVLLYRSAIIKENMDLAQGTAKVAASALDPEKIDIYLAEGESAEGYAETEKRLYAIRNSTDEILYVYVYKIDPSGCHVVFDLDTDELEGNPCGSVVAFDNSFSHYLPDLFAGNPIEPIITKDTFGWLLTAYEPVYDKEGKCVCYAAADISMDKINMIEREFLMEMLSLFLSFYILISVVIRWLVEYHIILPVNSIAMSTGTFAYDNEAARENSVERIRELNIHTGDEVENLYHAITKTSDDSMRYVADVQQKSAEISQLQKALILVLADIVESRDQNTGAHVRKTAAYTDIILHELQKEGLYPEILTDDYIDNVVNSAPLHDIGKIQVPDAILNKPGRLTDEEFSVMKQHTSAGRDILTQAIDLVPNSAYLNEARNLAGYHHEKWDGSGYPTGISGEEIPLSARVMAVADVFDALVSKRSYKEPFTYEAAMKIITEGSGKHFDPTVVNAFVRAGDQVRQIEEEFNRMTNENGCFVAAGSNKT
ncbi:MAG: HD domain-containing protein [Oscillospiraceae bacterium]|nr:HD domain-containing protein [Oscillospiraceae bacterium]